MNSNAPIGVFDSGIGGITVLKELIHLMPGENFIYFGDTARVPYGDRPKQEIISFTKEILDFFEQNQVKVAVAACNAMTTTAIDVLRDNYKFPIIGMDTGTKAALNYTKTKRIGVIATSATINSERHLQALKALDSTISIYPIACPKFVPLIEAGQLNDTSIYQAASTYLEPLIKADIDVLIIACTHYPFITPVLAEILGPKVTILDPAHETAVKTYHLLKNNQNLSNTQTGTVSLNFSAHIEHAKTMAKYLIKHSNINVNLIQITK